jgi:hypothetical protein
MASFSNFSMTSAGMAVFRAARGDGGSGMDLHAPPF